MHDKKYSSIFLHSLLHFSQKNVHKYSNKQKRNFLFFFYFKTFSNQIPTNFWIVLSIYIYICTMYIVVFIQLIYSIYVNRTFSFHTIKYIFTQKKKVVATRHHQYNNVHIVVFFCGWKKMLLSLLKNLSYFKKLCNQSYIKSYLCKYSQSVSQPASRIFGNILYCESPTLPTRPTPLQKRLLYLFNKSILGLYTSPLV